MLRRSSDQPFGRGHRLDDRLRTRPAGREAPSEEMRGTENEHDSDSDDSEEEEASLSRSSSRSTQEVMGGFFRKKSRPTMAGACQEGSERLSRSGTSPSESRDSANSSSRSNGPETSPRQVVAGTAQCPSSVLIRSKLSVEKDGTCTTGCGNVAVGVLKVVNSISRSSMIDGGSPKLGRR